MTGIGLARGTVRLVPYDPKWCELFEQESLVLQGVLGLKAETIQHVGSTAIPEIMAKPIIDIAIPVDSLDIAEVWAEPLANIGYWYKGVQPDMPNRRFFAKGSDGRRTVYLHVVNEEEFKRLLKFRDKLRDDGKLAKEYSNLKLNLAKGREDDRAGYSKLKNEFIQKILGG